MFTMYRERLSANFSLQLQPLAFWDAIEPIVLVVVTVGGSLLMDTGRHRII